MQVKRFEVHKSKVNDISIDHAVEFIASCSDDGSAAVSPLAPLGLRNQQQDTFHPTLNPWIVLLQLLEKEV